MKKKIWTSADLDLHSIEPVCKTGAIEAFDDQDGAAFAGAGYSFGATLAVVFDNLYALKQRGMFEAALIEGYIGCKTNHRRWSLSVIQFLFDQCDRDKLRAIGAPLPGPGPFTVYRGVYRNGRERQVHSFSWTGTLDVACRFALRGTCENPTPAVYRATVTADEVYCYCTERLEDEFVCRPKRVSKINMSNEEMQAAADRFTEALRADEAKTLEALRAKRKKSSSRP